MRHRPVVVLRIRRMMVISIQFSPPSLPDQAALSRRGSAWAFRWQGQGAANASHNRWRNAELHSGEAPFEGVIAASWEGRYRSPPRLKSLREIMKEKESNERD